MRTDPVSVALIVGFICAAAYFLQRPARADSFRAKLPKWLRGRGTEDPFYPFRSWTWTALPGHWLSAVITSAIAVIVFAAMATWFAFREGSTTTIVGFTSLIAAFHLFHTLRILRKVRQLKL
ncbi:MAG TPA: hypothetical protein VF773_23005 [Verrucomicrobiae bacterium]